MKTPSPRNHWLDNPKNVKHLWRPFIAVLALSVVAEFFVSLHPVFAIEGWFGFNADFGFTACVLMILGAKVLGNIIKRPDSYYAEDKADE